MAERISEYVLKLAGDDAELSKVFSSLKSRVKSDVEELERLTSKLDLFGQLTDNLPKVQSAIDKAKDQIKTLTAEIDKFKAAGDKAPTELVKGLADAEKQLKTASAEMKRQSEEAAKLQSALTKAGVDTKSLATEQNRLATATKEAADAAALQAAKQALGLTTLKDIQPEIAKLNAAYQTLQKSGTLSATETAAAQAALVKQTVELRASVTTIGTSALETGARLTSSFTGALLPALGLTTGIAGVVAVIRQAIDASREYEAGVLRIGTVTNLSQQQLDQLGEGVKTLARTIGFDLNDGLKGLYDLLRSGVPPDNAIEVLRISAIAAKAAQEDLNVGVKASSALLSSFQLPVSELAGALDLVAASAKTGGPTLKEFADNAGPLLVVAKAANVPLSELTAVLNVMTNATNDAGLSTTTLTKILQNLETKEARAKLHDLGIETGSLSETFRQLGERKLPIDEVLNLGLAGSRAAVGLLALTDNADKLTPALAATSEAIGTNQKIADSYADSAPERAKKLKAETDIALENLGSLLGSGSRLSAIASSLLSGFNSLSAAIGFLAKGGDEAGISFDGLSDAMNGTIKTSAAVAQAADETATRINELSKKIADATRDLAEITTRISDDAKKLQDSALIEVQSIKTAADQQIAALDKSAMSLSEHAERTLEIQRKSAQDRLAVLEKSEKEVNELTDRAVAKRESELRATAEKTKITETQIQAELAQIRLANIPKQIQAYQTFYDEQTRLAQQAASRVTQIEQARVAFNAGIEKQLFDIRVAGLSSFDQYVAKSKEADRLISEARKAAAAGDAKAAEDFAKQAIQVAGTLGEAYATNGAKIVTAGQAQQDKLKVIKEAAELVNASYEEQGEAARIGQVLAEVYQGRALANLINMNIEATDLQKKAAAGLQYKVTLDQKSYDDAVAQIAELTKEREVLIKVKTLNEPTLAEPRAAGGFVGSGFARGGYVQKFASGGPVGWKVPGMGNYDSVPALLQSGSFVVRKAASQMYGDQIMRMLARGYAAGGGVGAIASRILGGRSLLNLSPSTKFEYPDPRWVDNWSIPLPSGATDAQRLHAYKAEADGFFAKLMSWGNGVRRGALFGDLIDYIRDVGLNNVKKATDPDVALAWLDYFKKESDSFITTFRAAAASGGAAGRPLNVVSGLEQFDMSEKAIKERREAEEKRLKERREKYGFAAGGSAKDTVPAMLTPGEYVLQPSAVAKVSRMFGGSFLPALNAGRVPREALANALAPPQRFAMGGPVNYTPDSTSSGPPGKWSGDGVTVNIYGAPEDFRNESTIRRMLIPAMRNIQRRSGEPT